MADTKPPAAPPATDEEKAKKAARDEAKALLKEAWDEWYTEKTQARTDTGSEEKKRSLFAGGFFDGLLGR